MQIVGDELKLSKDPLAQLLISKIQEQSIDEALVYYNFPFYRGETKSDLVKAHVLFASREYGIVFFRCVDNENLFSSIERDKLEELDSHIFAKVNKHEQFRRGRRELKINVTPYVFVGSLTGKHDEFIGPNDIGQCINENKKESLSSEDYDLLVAVIEGTVNIKHQKDREVATEGLRTKGAVLNLIQAKQAVYDIEQKRAALNIIDSPQRIRGLAGSGKTIILTMKAALFHLDSPDKDVLYTYTTKALFGQVKYLIEKFYRDFSDNREPDWNKIHIWHGWGGKGLRGVYSDTCLINNVDTIPLPVAKRARPKDAFGFVCEELAKHELKKKFDLTLIDEGQDFPKEFYQVCRKITRDNRIVWAYDDFQNIFDIEMQDERETFGKDDHGTYYVDFSNDENKLQDIVLHKCYRNPRYVLLNSFALGLGIYNDKVLQRLESNQHWTDLGFEVLEGDSSDGSKMIITRPETHSPIETNEFFDEDSISFNTFDDFRLECEFIVESIYRDITEGNLRPDDICVIGLDNVSIRNYFTLIGNGLKGKGIQSFNLVTAPNNNTYFSLENHVTLSTINKAKGNETGMVYICGVDDTFSHKDSSVERNKLFTAMTRSKGWVSITGVQCEYTDYCKNEMAALKANNYQFKFIQPSENETKTIAYGMTTQQSLLNDLQTKINEITSSTDMAEEDVLKFLQTQLKLRKK